MRRLPVEEIDGRTKRDLEKRFEEYRSGKAEVVSSEEAVRKLGEILREKEGE